jgi:hypothetical protein
LAETVVVHEESSVALALICSVSEDVGALASQTVVGVSSTASSTRGVASIAGSHGGVHVKPVVAGADSAGQSRIVVARSALIVAHAVAGCTRSMTNTTSHWSSRAVVVEESVVAVTSGIC